MIPAISNTNNNDITEIIDSKLALLLFHIAILNLLSISNSPQILITKDTK